MRRHLAQCIGVFSGGGVRGAAYAGVCEKAEEHGLHFVGAVGVSAGAIAAALVAAQIDPVKMAKLLGDGFSKLLVPARPPVRLARGIAFRLANFLVRRQVPVVFVRHFYSVLLAGGAYSSEGIETWLESVLQEHLPGRKGPIRFRDLPQPLTIVAADLRQRCVKYWNRDSTPDFPVASAVRASCTIPLLFQPVQVLEEVLVDGGILSNLPVWLAGTVSHGEEAIPVVCFQLVGSGTRRPVHVDNGYQIAMSVLDTVLEGSVRIQAGMAAPHFLVKIPTGAVRSTSFSIPAAEIAVLRDSGATALEEFLADPDAFESHPPLIPATYGHRLGSLSETARLYTRAFSAIDISAGDMSWLRELQVHLLDARLRGVKVRMLCAPGRPPGKRLEKPSQVADALRAASALGIEVRLAMERFPLVGSLIDAGTDTSAMVSIESHPERHMRTYDWDNDRRLLEHVAALFEAEWEKGTSFCDAGLPDLVALGEEVLCNALRVIEWYRSASISLQDVNPASLLTLASVLEEFKLQRLEAAERLLEANKMPDGLLVRGSPWPITPVVVERQDDGRLVVVDGAHRVYLARQNRLSTMRTIVVDGVTAPLPGTPFPNWGHIFVANHKQERAERYGNYNKDYFRPIRAAFSKMALDLASERAPDLTPAEPWLSVESDSE